MEHLFGEQVPLPLRLVLALIVVFALIGLVLLVLRRVSGGKLGTFNLHGRQPRLGVMDMAHLDARRKLIIVRRDSVEHLIMIGGPNDVVIEQGIIRGQAVISRDEKSIAAALPERPAETNAVKRPQETQTIADSTEKS